jgi:hypothetical protein
MTSTVGILELARGEVTFSADGGSGSDAGSGSGSGEGGSGELLIAEAAGVNAGVNAGAKAGNNAGVNATATATATPIVFLGWGDVGTGESGRGDLLKLTLPALDPRRCTGG